MKRLSPVMLGGTGSDVGKSLIAAGLCRIFKQDGYNPAPFKAQNMALNSGATPDGLEIGRAQAVQAEAAGIPASTDMNPLLLKPTADHSSQVVLNGRVHGNVSAGDYFRREGREYLRREVHEAFDRLAARYNPIVMEGAGSIAEINLRDSDLVNMSMARYAGAKVILVADIDRGGVFASAYGSIMLQPEEDRRLIRGIIVNKFRGDLSLFEQGRRMMEETCGVPVLGVVPFAPDIHIDEEDSVALASKSSRPVAGKTNIAVVLTRHISNFTDFNALEQIPGVNLYYTATPAGIDGADAIILPGSKSTIADLDALRQSGMDRAVIEASGRGVPVMGICGGYQMMGMTVADPDGVEGEAATVEGLGLLPVDTVLSGEKVTRDIRFTFGPDGSECEGYEIHMGVTRLREGARTLNRLADGTADGCIVSARCLGTYIHGILDNRPTLQYLLREAGFKGEVPDVGARRQEQFDLLADHLRRHIDIQKLYKIMEDYD